MKKTSVYDGSVSYKTICDFYLSARIHQYTRESARRFRQDEDSPQFEYTREKKKTVRTFVETRKNIRVF